jgi:hypothetical protein
LGGATWFDLPPGAAGAGLVIQSRRLMRDHEVRIEHSEALIYRSMTKRMLAKIAA